MIIGALFWQCSETKELDPNDLGTNYYPLKVGEYRIYQVEGVRYFTYEDSVVFSYQLKETVMDTFSNLESSISFKILRQKRSNINESWVIDSLWTARKDQRTAVSVENNVHLVKLSFPVEENKTWDTNSLNDYTEDEFEMVDVRKPFSNDYVSYDNAVTVIQEDIPDVIVNTVSKKEVYGDNVGLVYKENIILTYRQDEFMGLEIIENGIRYYQYLVEYGEE